MGKRFRAFDTNVSPTGHERTAPLAQIRRCADPIGIKVTSRLIYISLLAELGQHRMQRGVRDLKQPFERTVELKY